MANEMIISNVASSAFAKLTGVSSISPIVLMDRALALTLRDTRWERQRKQRAPKINSYADQMLHGRWNGISSMKVAVTPEGKISQYDGQNRIEALLIATNTKPGLTIPISFIVHDVTNDNELGEDHFATTDYSGASRTKTDQNEGVGLPATIGISSASINAMYRGILTIQRGFREPTPLEQTRDMHDKTSKMMDAREFIEFYYPLIKNVKNDGTTAAAYSIMSGNSSFLALMYFLWLYADDRDHFRAFITRLVMDPSPNLDMYPKGNDPINRLMSLLVNKKVNRLLGSNMSKWVYIVGTAWNKFMESKGCPLLAWTDSKGNTPIEKRKLVRTIAKGNVGAWRSTLRG